MHRVLGLVVVAVVWCTPAFAQQKRIYIACDDHTDYFWTADDVAYRAAFLNMLDYYLDLADATLGQPADYQSRFACDGSFWLWEYERHKTPAEWNRLIDRIRSGHISVPLTALVSCYGGAPAEGVLRGMYYAGQLERRYGLRFRLAVAMENQTQPWGLASLWAGSGALYSWKGICACASQVPSPGDREHDIYWATGPDGQRVLMKWNSLFNNQSMGGYAEAWDVFGVVDLVTNNASFQARYPYPVIGCFGRGWDNLQTTTDEFVTAAQTLTNANRRVIVSNEEDFFADFAANYGAALPSQAFSYGNEWELLCASLAEVSAAVKRSAEKLRAAEALATLVSLHDLPFMSGRQTARDQAFMGWGLYWEHDWTGDGPVLRSVRAAWQRRIAGEIASYVDTLHADAAAGLGSLITSNGLNPRFYAFNPLGWTRTDYADLPWTDPAPVHVMEVAGGGEVPSQIITIDGGRTLRIWAQDVPAVGYKTYEVVPGTGAAFADAATVSGGGPEPTTVVYAVGANDRDAMSAFTGGPVHEVRTSGYSAGDARDYVGSDSELESAACAFQLDVPAGATVQEAHLIVRAGPFASASPTGGMEIHLYDTADVAPFADGAFGDLLNLHPTLPSTVFWPAPTWSAGTDQNSPNLAALVQAFVDRPDYVPGHHLGFVITEGTLEANRYYGWEDFAGDGTAPRLSVTYATPPGRSPRATVVMESDRYRLTVGESGAVTSLIDKLRGDREFAQLVNGRFVNDLGPSTGTLTIENAGPVSVTVRAVASSPLQHTSRITLYRDSVRIDLANDITQNFSATTTYGFGFALPAPQVRHEEVGAIARARLTTDGGHYATRQARYDWLTLNHFADMTGSDDAGVTLSNADCYYFRLGNSTVSTLDTSTPQISPLAGGQVDGPGLGIQNQGGDSQFRQRFALRTHDAYDPVAAMRFALEHQNPLVCARVTGMAARLPEATFSGVAVSDARVLLWALKPAEEGAGAGLIARLWNLSDTPATSTLQTAPRALVAAHRTTHLETDEGTESVAPTGLTALFAPQQLRTFRLIPGPRGDFDGNGDVDLTDFVTFPDCLAGPDLPPQPAAPITAQKCLDRFDFNGDGDVDLTDFGGLQSVLPE